MITHVGVGPTPSTFPRRPANEAHSSSGRMPALAVGPDGQRLYAGSVAGVWRSDDGGESWRQLTWPQPPIGGDQAEIPGALYAPRIFDIAVSPVDADRVLVTALDSQFRDGRDGLYLSVDGGTTWSLVLKSASQPKGSPFNVAFAPDDPRLVYAVGPAPRTTGGPGTFSVSRDAGQTWSTTLVGSSLWHLAVAPAEPDGIRRIYAVGDSLIWYSRDGGTTWRADGGVATIRTVRQQLTAFMQTCDPSAGVGGFGGATAGAVGDAAQILAVEPGTPSKVYLATGGGANGPTYYSDKVADGTPVNSDCRRLAGEASLWLGDFSGFEQSGAAQWSLLPGPPVYTFGSTPSGNRFVEAKPTSAGFLLFFSDNSHVHVSAGTPTAAASWHRLDGMDASETKRSGRSSNVLFVHVDPHAIAFTSDFEITLKTPTGVEDPYDQNSELDQHVAGRIWMANDGGVYYCDDGGRRESSWQMPHGIETIDPVNIAGLFGHGGAPALYLGCGDNNDFFTRDGGAHWGDPRSGCGDCDAWFSDSAQADRVLQFLPRRSEGQLCVIANDGSGFPDAGDGNSKTFVPSTKKISFANPSKLAPYAASDVYLAGYRPLVRTLATEVPLPDGDVVIIEQAMDGTAALLRTRAIRSIKQIGDWLDPVKAQPVGPPLPASAITVQASGGHGDPAYYVGNRSGSLWRLTDDKTRWDAIVPKSLVTGTSVGAALAWFVDPYEPESAYVLDSQAVKLTVDGGRSWFLDPGLTRALTAGGKLAISASLLQDMQFSRGERQTRFALGTAGVFCTMDFGVSWFPVLNSIALPGRPESGFFDPLSDQSDRALYLACEGRSILRIGGLPPLSPFEPQHPIDLWQMAALEY